MRVEFLHLADVHLGYQQYGHQERFNDFGRAYLAAIDYAIEHRINFVLISGDLFHKSAIDPPTLLQAVTGFDKLKQANIKVVAITGNHDAARYRDGASWLDYLAERGYIALLSASYDEDKLHLTPWNGYDGAYIDIDKVRIVGMSYLGAATQTVIADLPQALAAAHSPDIEFTILMAHAGLEGEMPRITGGLTQNDLAPLKRHVDYLAMGHLHKPFERENWIFNPGSLEVCDMGESRWEGGFYHVAVDTDKESRSVTKHIKSQRRPFHRLIFSVDTFTSPTKLYDSLRQKLEEEKRNLKSEEWPPVIEISLEGVLNFDRVELDILQVQTLVEEIISPLLVRVRNNTRPVEFEIAPEEHGTRTDLELAVLRDLVLRDGRYQSHALEWSNLLVEVKDMVLAGSLPEAVVTTVRQRVTKMAQGNNDVDQAS